MTEDQIIAALDAVDTRDPEGAHCLADDLLMASAPRRVQDAYARLVLRTKWWACA